jgi:hypothetical protein
MKCCTPKRNIGVAMKKGRQVSWPIQNRVPLIPNRPRSATGPFGRNALGDSKCCGRRPTGLRPADGAFERGAFIFGMWSVVGAR